MTEHADTAQIFKALAHPARLRILETLEQGEACVCHLEALLGFRQAYLSQQLAVLRQAGLVGDRREGLNVFYCLMDERVPMLLRLMRGKEAAHVDHVSPAAVLPNCSCPRCRS
ncbi:MAG: metalloregulator ArsR/SmtB family transcription factor [Anaerolineae bacterium]|nr:metalloregulator ArsR/SmtB family transcription factor [Anaerolineae bacterium]